MDNKVAFTLIALVEILLWVDLEHKVAHLESNRLDFWSDLFAWLFDVAEGLI